MISRILLVIIFIKSKFCKQESNNNGELPLFGPHSLFKSLSLVRCSHNQILMEGDIFSPTLGAHCKSCKYSAILCKIWKIIGLEIKVEMCSIKYQIFHRTIFIHYICFCNVFVRIWERLVDKLFCAKEGTLTAWELQGDH